MNLWHGSILLLGAAAGASTGALAQTTTTAANEPDAGEIVVTAQKREQALNDVGMSITAATGEQLLNKGITNPSDLVKLVPGLTFTNSQLGLPVYTIRGVGFYEATLAAAPTVSVYVDEIPLPFSALTQGASLDIQRVEVLKGPQGTLFGQNATGGAINYIAAKPTQDFEAGFDITGERFGKFDLSGFASGPISETLAARVSLRTVQGGDWQKSWSRPDDELGNNDQTYARLLLDWTPTDRLKISLNLNRWSDFSDVQAPQAVIKSPMVPGQQHPAFDAYVLPPRSARWADWTAGWPMKKDIIFWQASGRIDYDLTDDLTLTSISSYQKYDGTLFVDTDATPLVIFDGRSGGRAKNVFQELRVTGQTDALNYILGVNYAREKTTGVQDYLLEQGSLANQGPFGILTRSDLESTQNIRTLAAFANVEYAVTDRLNVQAGVRYTENKRDFEACVLNNGAPTLGVLLKFLADTFGGRTPDFAGLPADACVTVNDLDGSWTNGAFVDTLKEDNVSWRAGVNYTAFDDTLLYANVSKGYKSGGFSAIGASFMSHLLPAVQEEVLAYELGFKTPLLDRRLQLNAAAFYYDYKNKQLRGRVIDEVFGPIEKLINVPKSEVKGVEVELVADPIDGLTLSGGATYLDSKIKRKNGLPFFAVNSDNLSIDYTGSRFPFTPEWTAVADAQYEWGLSDSLDAFVGGSLTYNSATNQMFETKAFPALSTAIQAYTLIDVRAGIAASDDSWRLTVFGRNITNNYYWYGAFDAETAYRLTGKPVTYGLTLSYRLR